MTKILRLGSRGPKVKTLQEKLNSTLKQGAKLRITGNFDENTRSAVLRLQRLKWLVEDGVVGPSTWNALMETEGYLPVLYLIPFIPQPTQTTCWAASTAMVTRSTVQAVIAQTPADLILPAGDLKNFSDTSDPITGSTRFANANGMTVVPPTSWMPSALKSMLSQGPLIFDMLWNVANYSQGAGSPGHMVAIVGIRGDNDENGLGTTLRIYDPWPPGKGKKYSKGYSKWLQEVPTITYHIYHKR
ncbi:MAG: peptidoglycan-binding protein [Bacteroidales bacterium]|nr:peptidoglycan-binding protein [Bacteroidales bacterium]